LSTPATQYLIGTDEAGYGPNLGPLVVSASVWEVPRGVSGEDLYARLADVIVPTPRAAAGAAACVAMADSKALYKPGTGLRHLERGLFTALALLGREPKSWRGTFSALTKKSATEAAGALATIPWYADYDCALPLDARSTELPPLIDAVGRGLADADVRMLDLRSRAVFPEEFNRLLQQHGSKGTVLSHTTLDLVAQLARPLEERPMAVVCDKHGGRNRYFDLLSEHFPDFLIEIHGESRRQSVYRFGPDERRTEFRFRTKGESSLPTALASMASKYLRELAMRALNAFWGGRVADLRRTAGYPQDAKRFKAAIAASQEELGIEDRVLWRVK